MWLPGPQRAFCIINLQLTILGGAPPALHVSARALHVARARRCRARHSRVSKGEQVQGNEAQSAGPRRHPLPAWRAAGGRAQMPAQLRLRAPLQAMLNLLQMHLTLCNAALSMLFRLYRASAQCCSPTHQVRGEHPPAPAPLHQAGVNERAVHQHRGQAPLEREALAHCPAQAAAGRGRGRSSCRSLLCVGQDASATQQRSARALVLGQAGAGKSAGRPASTARQIRSAWHLYSRSEPEP